MKDKNSEERLVERSSRKRSSESIPYPWRRSFGDSIWDWGTAAKLCVGAWRRAWGRITALAYLNAHEHALLAVASHSGQLALFRPARGALEPALLAAWRALPAQPAGDYRPPPAHPVYSQSIPPHTPSPPPPCTCISSIVFGAFTYHMNGSATKNEYIIRDPCK